MSSPRIITVFGGTGLQGSSVVKAVVADGTFTPRVVTRDATSEAAQKLRSQGIETVQANLADPTSLRKALQGSECVFGVTQFAPWDKGYDEVQQGRDLIDASKDVGVKLFIWSSLTSATEESGGKYKKVAHFDNKIKVEKYLATSGVSYVILRTSFFLENLINYDMLRKVEGSNELTFHVPLVPSGSPVSHAFTWIERDLGPSVVAVSKNYHDKSVAGQTLTVARARMTYEELCTSFSKALGKPVKFVTGPSTGIEDLDEMYLFHRDFGMYPGKQVPDPILVALGVDFSAPFTDYAEELKKSGF